MAEVVIFPTETACFDEDISTEATEGDRFLRDEGLELLADFRAIEDRGVRASLRALVRSLARGSQQAVS